MVFTFLSPLVRKRLVSLDKSIKNRLEVETLNLIKIFEGKLANVGSNHFMPIKWSLQVINEARLKDEIDEKLFNSLINEINTVHTQCDRLINFKHETFSWGLTKGVKTSVYTFFVVGAVSSIKCLKCFLYLSKSTTRFDIFGLG